MKTLLPRLSCLILTALLALLGSSAEATDRTWNGGGADDNWQTSGNWGGTAPSANDLLFFGGTTRLTAVNDFTANTMLNGITFNSGAGAFVLSGNAITLNGGVTNNAGSGTKTINLDMTLAVNSTVRVVSGGTLSIGGVISGTGFGLTKVNAGTLTISANNTFSGGLVFNDGRINFNHNNAAGSGTITVNSGADDFVSAASGIVLANAINLDSAAAPLIYATSGNTLEQTGVISGLGGLVRNDTGAGTLTLSGANTYSGGFKIVSRGVTLNNKGALGTGTFTIGDTVTAPANAITLQTGSDLTGANAVANAITVNRDFTLAGANELELSGPITLTMTPVISVSSAANLKLSGVISSGSFGLTKADTGTLTLGGDNTFTGGVTISGGIVQLNHAGALNSTTPNALSMGGGSLRLNGHSVTVSALSGSSGTIENNHVSTAATLTVNKASGSDTYSGVLQDGSTAALALTKTGSGTLVLNNANTYTGGTTLSQGTLTLGADNALGSGGFTFAGGILNANSRTDSTIGALSLTANSTLNLVDDLTRGTLTFDSAAYSSGTLTIYGWSGSAGGPNSANGDQILITTPSQSFLDNLHQVQFDLGGQLYFGKMSGNELMPDLTAVPEPINVALGVFGGVFVGIGFVRRFRARRPPVAT